MAILSKKTCCTTTEEEIRDRECGELHRNSMVMVRRLFLQPKVQRVLEKTRKLYQTPDGNNFNIDIELHTCVHGYLSWKRQPASLIVFALKFMCIGKHGSFKRIKFRVDFEDLPGVAATTSPGIISHAPFESEEHQKVVEAKIQKKHGQKVSVSAGSNGTGINVNGGIKFEASKEEISTYIAKYFSKGTSATVTNDKEVHSGIWWNVKQSTNPVAKDDAGIESDYRCAVLLTRENNEPFQARLNLLVDAGWRYKAQNMFSPNKTIHGESSTLSFSPATYLEGHCGGINRKRLGRFKGAKLKQLTQLNR